MTTEELIALYGNSILAHIWLAGSIIAGGGWETVAMLLLGIAFQVIAFVVFLGTINNDH